MPGDPNFELADAILKNEVARANEILDEHPDLGRAVLVHPQTTDSTPAIILAASRGTTEIVRRLLEIDVDTETAYDKEGWRPLHIAAQRNHIDVAKIFWQSCFSNTEQTSTFGGATATHF